jgi:hypothetical protein
MFTGNTINELMCMVERAEDKVAAVEVERDFARYSMPVFNVYGFEQFKQFEREVSLMGVA